MTVRITTNEAVGFLARVYVDNQDPVLTEKRKLEILPATKYNLLVYAFNTSTVLLVAAVASAILFAFSTSMVLGSIALFTRFAVEKEIDRNYALPIQGGIEKMLTFSWRREAEGEREERILQKVGQQVVGWNENAYEFDEWALWKNTVPVL